MVSPYQFVPPSSRRSVFWVLAAVSVLLLVVLNLAGANLVNDQAPYGIVSFELAGSTEKAGAILTSWNDAARISAAFNLVLDYLFMLAYATAIGLGSLVAGEALARRGWPLARLGPWLGWALILAALCDAIENRALWLVLNSSPGPGMLDYRAAGLARSCALIKFGLVFFGLFYLFYAGTVVLVRWLGVRQ